MPESVAVLPPTMARTGLPAVSGLDEKFLNARIVLSRFLLGLRCPTNRKKPGSKPCLRRTGPGSPREPENEAGSTPRWIACTLWPGRPIPTSSSRTDEVVVMILAAAVIDLQKKRRYIHRTYKDSMSGIL